MARLARSAALVVCAAALCACTGPRQVSVRFAGQPGVSIPGIDGCDDFGERELPIDPSRPITILVHGCKASSSRLRTLAQVFAAHDQQAVCFSYDERASMEDSSADLLLALQMLSTRTRARELTVLGHSQGGLVARRALIDGRGDGLRTLGGRRLRLVTVSSPFHGIRAASHCGLVPLHVVSLGITAGVCQAIAGSKWNQIHPRARFVRQPGALAQEVIEHLQILTDERGTCRRQAADGSCDEDDFVFGLDEQRSDLLERDPRTTAVELGEGHAAVIGLPGRPPERLIQALQEHGVLAETPPEQREALSRLLARLY